MIYKFFSNNQELLFDRIVALRKTAVNQEVKQKYSRVYLFEDLNKVQSVCCFDNLKRDDLPF